MFRIGQKVVCIGWINLPDVPFTPEAYRIPRGSIVTVRDYDTRGVAIGAHKYATVRFEEVIRPLCEFEELGQIWEPGYVPMCFRPVVEKKTNISVFEEILMRETVDDRAPAHSS